MTLEFEYSAEDWRQSTLSLMRRRPMYWVFCAWFALAAIACIVFWRGPLSLPPIIVGLFFSVYLPIVGPRKAAKLSLLTPNTQGTMHFEIGVEGVRIHNACFDGLYAWAAFVDIAEVNSGFILYVGPAVYWLIPKRVFADEAQIDQFRSLASQYKPNGPDGGAPIAAP